jgi:hypothetical protein
MLVILGEIDALLVRVNPNTRASMTDGWKAMRELRSMVVELGWDGAILDGVTGLIHAGLMARIHAITSGNSPLLDQLQLLAVRIHPETRVSLRDTCAAVGAVQTIAISLGWEGPVLDPTTTRLHPGLVRLAAESSNTQPETR